MPDTEVEDLLRRLAPRVLGAVVRRYGHFDTAEDAVQEALLAAAVQWPKEGVPDNPQGWLITVASRRLTDLLRSEQARQCREDTVARRALPGQWLAPAADRPASKADDTLILLFMCCHPSLSPATQIALTLRAVGGLTTAEIARAFLVPEPRDLDGARLMFVPVTPRLGWVSWHASHRFAVVYPCSGALAEADRTSVPEALGKLLGPARAGVLILLDTPKSTTQLVALTGQGLGSVGRHLKILLDTHLIRRQRAGRSVLYYWTDAGDVLVKAQQHHLH